MTNIEDLKDELKQIKERNKRVESDKAWETSWTRRDLAKVYSQEIVLKSSSSNSPLGGATRQDNPNPMSPSGRFELLI